MKRYTLSAANAFTHVPEHPERTARRSCFGLLNFDVEYQVWPSRQAMLTTLNMQARRAPTPHDWRRCERESHRTPVLVEEEES